MARGSDSDDTQMDLTAGPTSCPDQGATEARAATY